MKRDLTRLTGSEFDVAVVGGGIYGACIARDAALRGLSVALVERDDFGHATSHNSLRLIHGGLRYLQHLDFRRVRESLREQNFWLRAAPHLVRPLQFIMPTYGLGTRGPIALWGATKVHAAVGFDRNQGIDASLRLPAGGLVSKTELLNAVPGMDESANAGATWYDAQMIDPDRLIIDVLDDAVGYGATIANYCEAVNLLEQGGAVTGIAVRDVLTGSEYEVRARTTVNAAGPWVERFVARSRGRLDAMPPLTKGMNLVTRRVGPAMAFAVRSRRKSDAVIGDSNRMYFCTPSLHGSIIGTSHFEYRGDPDDCEFTAADAARFLEEFNDAYPAAKLSMDDVHYWHGGLTPAEESNSGAAARSRQANLMDHSKTDELDGLVSVRGVKYTTARLVAEKAVDLAAKKLGMDLPSGLAWRRALRNAALRDGDSPLLGYGRRRESVEARRPGGVSDELGDFIACCRHGIHEEMAVTLDDLLLRRTMHAREGRMNAQLFAAAVDVVQRESPYPDAADAAAQERARERLAACGVRVADNPPKPGLRPGTSVSSA